ncbi:MAG: thiamine pyrophosphate-binding protein [Mesorhizobium sp.]|nr:MAG: thiamine pyrophosphate-binding protein [Mesorhizobium sp.]RWC65700.1 MAG: thiamine pyrophosphate-binding protein [Mesorhizobium sp.]
MTIAIRETVRTMTGAELIVDVLTQNGFHQVFGVPGRRVLPIYDAIYRAADKIRIVASQNEQGAAFMADGYARARGRSCCLGISGPGLLNMVTGVAASYYDSVPVLVLGGQAQTKSIGKYAIQEATGHGRSPDQLEIFRRITKKATRAQTADDIVPVLTASIEEMFAGRPGPVYIEFPTDILHQEIAPGAYRSSAKPPVSEDASARLEKWPFQALVADLSRAKFPVILVGQGVNASGARDEVKRIAEGLGIPFVTTTLAKGTLPEDSELSLGSCGIWGQPAAKEYLLGPCDAILAFGTTFQELSSYGWRIRNEQILLRVDIDEGELHRNYSGKHSFLGDAKDFLTAFERCLSMDREQTQFPEAKALVATLKNDAGFYATIQHTQEHVRSDLVNPIALVKAISRLTPQDVPIISDVGENGAWSMYLIQREKVGSYVINAGLGTMGHAVAAAVGVSLALPGNKIVSICGDGGFMMNGNEIATAAKYRSDVLWIVFNNGILGTQKHYQRDYLDGRYIASDMPDIDYCRYAESLGVSATRVKTIDEFDTEYKRLLKIKGNHLIEVCVDPNIKPEPCYFY